MKHLFLFLLLIVFYQAAAQAPNENDILTCTQKRVGVYMSFAEFRSNSPSVSDTSVLGDGKRKKSKVKGTPGPDPIAWGYCTGEKVYHQAEAGRYVEFKTLDRYCLFTAYYTNHIPVMVGSGMIPIGIPVEGVFVLNINNGNYYQLTKKIMKKILEQDEELYAQYKADKKRKKRYEFYIMESCKRNPGQIKPF